MRHFAMTGIVTASWISWILSGLDMRATPPSRRMSAGTRSSAITATAPASSAIFACSALTTSMITPPLSISASPLLTRIVPISAMRVMLPGQKGLDGVPKSDRLLQVREVPGAVDHDDLGARNRRPRIAGGRRAADEVVAAGDDQRRRGDAFRGLAE